VPSERAADAIDTINSLESKSTAENFAQRISGFICPPRDGDYVFVIASDDNSSLSLSSDESPKNRREIARVGVWTLPRQWDKFPTQRSKPVTLRARQRYFFEILHKQGQQGAHVEVAWQGPGTSAFSVLEASALAPAAR
jgi:hypothetical protein